MILQLLKSNRSINYFLFLLTGGFLWMKSFLEPGTYSFYPGETSGLLYQALVRTVDHSAKLQNIVALALVVLLAFILQQINNRYNFIRERTMLPALLFIVIVSGFTQMNVLHPVYFASVFLLLSINRLFSAFEQEKSLSPAFDSGFWLGVGSLFYLNTAVIFPALLIGIRIITRDYQWRKFVLVTLGFILPFLFAAAYAFYFDELSQWMNSLKINIITPNRHFEPTVQFVVYLSYIALLTIIGTAKIIQQYGTKKVSTRKYFSVFFLIFLFSVSGYVFIPATSQEMLIIIAVPLTFLISNFFVFFRNRFWGEIIFDTLLVIIIAQEILA